MTGKRSDTDAQDAFLEELNSADPSPLEDLLSLGEALPRPAPSAALRARLLASARHEGRFAHHAAEVARLLDLSPEAAGTLLDSIAEQSRWGPGPAPGVGLYHVAGGPAVENAVTGFVRVDPGTTFPTHGHLGPETVLILQGACQDSLGTRLVAGDLGHMEPGSEHSFEVPADGMPLLFLAVIQEGIEMFGQKMGPRHPGA